MTSQNSNIHRTINMLETQYNNYYNDIQFIYENNRQLQINIQENNRTLTNMYHNNCASINLLYQNLDYLRSLIRDLNTLTPSIPTTPSFDPTTPSFEPSGSFGFFCSCGTFHNHSLCSTSNNPTTPLYARTSRTTGSYSNSTFTQTPLQTIPQTPPRTTPQTPPRTTPEPTPQTTPEPTPQTNPQTPPEPSPQLNTDRRRTNRTSISRETTPSRFDFYYFVSNRSNDIGTDDDIPDLEDVEVRPTLSQIQNAVRNIQYSNIITPLNETCPISLEPFQQQDIVTQIIHCNHIFNSSELNHWFDSNVHCPVCRYDIRNYQITPNITPLPNITLTSTTNSRSNTRHRGRNRHLLYNTESINSRSINWNDLLTYVADTVIDLSYNT